MKIVIKPGLIPTSPPTFDDIATGEIFHFASNAEAFHLKIAENKYFCFQDNRIYDCWATDREEAVTVFDAQMNLVKKDF